MLFNSLEFCVFLPVAFALYWLLARAGLRAQNAFLILAGYFFYGWWDWRFLFLLAFSSCLDFALGIWIGDAADPRRKRMLLLASIGANVGFLGYFKYFNFFARSFSEAFTFMGARMDAITLNVVLPVGISFYTFQSLSYTIDVYRGKLRPERDPVAYFAFVGFFPQLLAGPIERATHLLPQFGRARAFDPDRAAAGLKLILLGAFKKIVVADTLALYVDAVYGSIPHHSGPTLALATVFFAFQIYCDFSGYSDMARGFARLFGFELMVNFARPYLSGSVREFWTRWHISLSSWFRDYVYIPLGGSRGGALKTWRNYLITFLVSGLWHGANWTFAIWGILHGLFVTLEDMAARLGLRFPGGRITAPIRMALTFALVCLGWIFFRCHSVGEALQVVRGLGRDGPLNILDGATFANCILAAASLVAVEVALEKGWVPAWLPRPAPLRYAVYSLAVILIALQGSFVHSQFIYFQF